jgi:ubiquinone/menaquinone biosynthesis C-methylase UbiE
MKTAWDYSDLAQAYLKRPDYSDAAIDAMLAAFGAGPGAAACDVGAGVGHLSLMLAQRGLCVTAIEPNDNMRRLGAARCRPLAHITYVESTAERTGQPSGAFDCVTFGSSFNVTDREASLREAARILKPTGWIAALWNHRDLDDPIQAEIESIIRSHLPCYDYGTRREDQTPIIEASGLFDTVQQIAGPVVHTQPVADVVEAWRSHATVQRQAGENFPRIVDAIAAFLNSLGTDEIRIPYTTRIWLARRLH